MRRIEEDAEEEQEVCAAFEKGAQFADRYYLITAFGQYYPLGTMGEVQTDGTR